MKKIIFLMMTFMVAGFAVYATGNKTRSLAPGATIQGLWVEHGMTEKNRLGMRIHVAITVWEMKGKEAILCFDFRHNDDDPFPYIFHKGVRDDFHPDSGYLSIETIIKPNYEESIYDDISVFMPYDEFRLAEGSFDLAAEVHLMRMDHSNIAFLDAYEFELTYSGDSRGAARKPSFSKKNPIPNTGPRATFDSSWIEHNVTVEGKLGMNLHYRFSTYEMKDSSAYVMALFRYNGKNTFVLDKNKTYASSDGIVTTYMKISPAFPEAWFKDLALFIPYDEVEVAQGSHDLIIDTRLIYTDGRLISSFGFLSYKHTKP